VLWFTLVIPPIVNAEIGRIMVQGQSRLKGKCQHIPISTNKPGMAAHPSYTGGIARRIAAIGKKDRGLGSSLCLPSAGS
jgi:hypothetical protein